jgi:hypothetical protein
MQVHFTRGRSDVRAAHYGQSPARRGNLLCDSSISVARSAVTRLRRTRRSKFHRVPEQHVNTNNNLCVNGACGLPASIPHGVRTIGNYDLRYRASKTGADPVNG